MKTVRRVTAALLVLLLLAAGLFAFNGLVLARKTNPVSGFAGGLSSTLPSLPAEPRIMAFNIAKGFVYAGRGRFAENREVETRLEEICDIIRRRKPDILFLSEAVFECGPSGINQVAYIARHTDMPYWVFGENFFFGLPLI